MANKKVDFVFCIVPKNTENYNIIKNHAAFDSAILTGCFLSDTIRKMQNPNRPGAERTIILNELLKVNTKLNGVNHKLMPTSAILKEFDKVPVMFIGADVTHPTPGHSNVPSVAAVVASYNRHASLYKSGWCPQIGEIITDFGIFVKEALHYFYKENGKLPLKIVYLRDGVSDSQFKEVLKTEWNAMLDAFKDFQHIQRGYEKIVKVTMLIVQKRHHTRFFPGKTGISDDRNNNVPTGTVVDTTITRPDEAQYYLISHQAIQGVARPTKYTILLDDGKHSKDELIALTNDVSILYNHSLFCMIFLFNLICSNYFHFVVVPRVCSLQSISFVSSANILCTLGSCPCQIIYCVSFYGLK